ncbi:hypothetical protein ACE6H2_010174 [Prunus campanulata]
MAQARVNMNPDTRNPKYHTLPDYRLSLFERKTASWAELPMMISGILNGLSRFYQLVGVGSDLVVMGGWDPDTWEVSNSNSRLIFIISTTAPADSITTTRRRFTFAQNSISDFPSSIFVEHSNERTILLHLRRYRNHLCLNLRRPMTHLEFLLQRRRIRAMSTTATSMQTETERRTPLEE